MRGMEGTPITAGPEVQVRSFLSSLASVDAEGLTEAERVAVVAALEALKGARGCGAGPCDGGRGGGS